MDNRPTKEEAIRESLILWRELATNPKCYDVSVAVYLVKQKAIRRLIEDGLLPERATGYNSDCPLCAAVFCLDGERRRVCEKCPWPGSGKDRCVAAGVFKDWTDDLCSETARPVFELMKQLAKGEAAPTFKVGDRVKLVDMTNRYGKKMTDNKFNPFWGGVIGKIRGTVSGPNDDDYYTLCVSWDNGEKNEYNPRNLALLSTADEDHVEIVAGQLYRYEDQVLLATDDGDDDWFDFYTLAGVLAAGNPADDDVFTGFGNEIPRNKLIPTGKSLQDLYARAE